MRRAFQTILCAIVLCLLKGRPACAQAGSEETLIQQGLDLRRQSQDAAALERFQQAFELTHSARAQAEVGLAEQALGRWLDADAHLGAALARSADGWIAQNRATLEQARRVILQHVGHIEVLGGVAGARVLVNGQPAGTLPLAGPLRALVGTTVLEVRAEGYNPVQRNVTVPAGAPARETIEMVPLAPAPAPAPLPAPLPAQSAPTTPGGGLTDAVPHRGATTRVLAWVTAAGAVVGLGLGVGGYLLGTGAANDYNTRYAGFLCRGADTPAASDTGSGCMADRSNASAGQALETAGFIAGGVLAATSVVLFLATPASRPAASAGIECGVGPGRVGVACGGSF